MRPAAPIPVENTGVLLGGGFYWPRQTSPGFNWSQGDALKPRIWGALASMPPPACILAEGQMNLSKLWQCVQEPPPTMGNRWEHLARLLPWPEQFWHRPGCSSKVLCMTSWYRHPDIMCGRAEQYMPCPRHGEGLLRPWLPNVVSSDGIHRSDCIWSYSLENCNMNIGTCFLLLWINPDSIYMEISATKSNGTHSTVALHWIRP